MAADCKFTQRIRDIRMAIKDCPHEEHSTFTEEESKEMLEALHDLVALGRELACPCCGKPLNSHFTP